MQWMTLPLAEYLISHSHIAHFYLVIFDTIKL